MCWTHTGCIIEWTAAVTGMSTEGPALNTSPPKGKQTEVHSNHTVNSPLAAPHLDPGCPIRGSDQNLDQSQVRIWLLTRRLDWVKFERKSTRTEVVFFLPHFKKNIPKCPELKQSWLCRRGRGKRAYFCAFSVCVCLFMRFTSSCPERGTRTTERCATWGSQWAAPKSSPPGIFCFPPPRCCLSTYLVPVQK